MFSVETDIRTFWWTLHAATLFKRFCVIVLRGYRYMYVFSLRSELQVRSASHDVTGKTSTHLRTFWKAVRRQYGLPELLSWRTAWHSLIYQTNNIKLLNYTLGPNCRVNTASWPAVVRLEASFQFQLTDTHCQLLHHYVLHVTVLRGVTGLCARGWRVYTVHNTVDRPLHHGSHYLAASVNASRIHSADIMTLMFHEPRTQ